MKKIFTVYNNKGNKGTIELGEVVKKGNIFKIEIVELRFKGNIVLKNEIATLAKTIKSKNLLMQFNKTESLLKITSQELIEELWKLNDKSKSGILYNYTSEYKRNYLD